MSEQIVRCPSCGANNRISSEKAQGHPPVCGRCKTPLPLGGEPQVVTDATFTASVERAALPVLVDMWAPWCGPCRMISPIIDGLAKEFVGKVAFTKLNIDDNPQTASRFRVDSIPTLLIFKNGKEVDRLVGLLPAPEIRRRVDAAAR